MLGGCVSQHWLERTPGIQRVLELEISLRQLRILPRWLLESGAHGRELGVGIVSCVRGRGKNDGDCPKQTMVQNKTPKTPLVQNKRGGCSRQPLLFSPSVTAQYLNIGVGVEKTVEREFYQ